MTAPCDCRACAPSAYVRLLHSAQQDQDAAHRQQAMDYLARIGPMSGTIGADGSCRGDGLADPMLRRHYPDETLLQVTVAENENPQPGPQPHDVIAGIEAAAIKQLEQLADDARHKAGMGR